MPSQNELWYAARMTKVVYRPPRLLETFGETAVFYSVLSEIFDSESKIRLRSGIIRAARPKVVTPHFFLNQALENFGADARKYFADLLQRKDGARILQYGLTFQKEEHSEEIIGGEILEAGDRRGRGGPGHGHRGGEAEGGAGQVLAREELAFLVAGRVAVDAERHVMDEVAAALDERRAVFVRAGIGRSEEGHEAQRHEAAGEHSGHGVGGGLSAPKPVNRR